MNPPDTITTQKSLVTENGSAQSKPRQGESSEISKLLIANVSFAVWLIFLAFGGGILALYYARIGYLPEIEWKASLVYLFIGSIVGGVIGLLLTISLYLPGVIWAETIVFDRCLRFSYAPPSGTQPEREQVCIRSIINYLGVPFLFVLLLSHIALLAGKVWYWLIAVALLGLTFFVMRSRLKSRLLSLHSADKTSESSQIKDKSKTVARHVFKLASLFTLSVLLNQISMYVIYWLSGNPVISWTFVILTLLCTTGVSIASHVVALRHRDYPRQAVAASLVAAGLLLFTADNFSSLSVKLMNHFGIGYNKRVNLLVTNNGKNIVDGLGIPKCGDLQLCNVEILSKVGDQYFLRVGDTTYVTLPKSDVVAVRPLN
jgi:hypothetical protein